MLCSRGEDGCIGPKQKDADMWDFWELFEDRASKDCNLDVNHVKANRTEKEKKMVMKGNAKTDELASEG